MWEGIIIDGTSGAGTREEMTAENLRPMGSKDQILDRFKKTFGSVKMLDDNLILVRGGDFDIHFDIGDDEPVRSIKVTTNGEIYLVLELLHERYRWRVFDLQVNDYLEFGPGQSKENGVADEEKIVPSVRDVSVPLSGAISVFARCFFIIAALLVLDMTARPYIENSLARGVASTLISLVTLYLLYRFGRNNEFVKSFHALFMSLAVSLTLVCLNVFKNWHIAVKIEDPEVVKALSFAFILKALIYFIFVFLGVKIRLSKKGEQTLEFRWR